MVAVIAGIPVDGSWEPGDPLDVLREMKGVDGDTHAGLIATFVTSMGITTLPSALPADPEASCRVVETLADGSACPASAVMTGSCRAEPSAPARVAAALLFASACLGDSRPMGPGCHADCFPAE